MLADYNLLNHCFLANMQCNNYLFFFNHAKLFIINKSLTTNEYWAYRLLLPMNPAIIINIIAKHKSKIRLFYGMPRNHLKYMHCSTTKKLLFLIFC